MELSPRTIIVGPPKNILGPLKNVFCGPRSEFWAPFNERPIPNARMLDIVILNLILLFFPPANVCYSNSDTIASVKNNEHKRYSLKNVHGRQIRLLYIFCVWILNRWITLCT